MNKKYELIADGANKRIKALRSFKVQDRYVNIGDVGGIVYDEKTLSQDGNAWIFRGNYSCPTVRIAGDAVIDTNEVGALGATPLVTIDGESKIVGVALNFVTNVDEDKVLTPDMFEGGTVDYGAGVSWETWKAPSPNYIRLKKPLFVGAGSGQSLKIEVEGYAFQAYWIDRDGNGIGDTATTNSGAGVSIAIPSNAVYMYLRMSKVPVASIALSEVNTAKPTMSRIPREANVLIRDTKVIDMVTGNYYIHMGTIGAEAKYDQIDSSFVNSTIEFTKPIGANVVFTFCTEMVNTHATVDFSGGGVKLIGRFSNVEDLQVSGSVNFDSTDPKALDNCMIAKDCKTLAYNPTVFPGALPSQQANRPFRFTRCNVPNGIFYDHPRIENTYRDIDFSLASADLGKTFSNGRTLVSSEVPGMYRLGTPAGTIYGLIESHASVAAWLIGAVKDTYDSIIYADAYLSGKVEVAGTVVLGGTRKHDQAQPIRIEGRAVQGMLTSTVAGEKITGVTEANDRVSVIVPIRVGGVNAISVKAPDTIESLAVFVDAKNVITATLGWRAGNHTIEGASNATVRSADKVYLVFRVKGGGLLKPEDLKDVSVVEYHGCKIINTGVKELTIKGNIRVEDDAHLINASVEGSGYFGGRSTTSNANIIGSAYMDDNAVYANGEVAEITDLKMRDNAHYEGMPLESIISLTMYDNSACYGTVDLLNGSLFMMDNAEISADATVDVVGSLVMKDNAIVDSALNTSGRIVLQGDYNQATQKTWKGCRNIDSENAPVYGGNVKTRHDYF